MKNLQNSRVGIKNPEIDYYWIFRGSMAPLCRFFTFWTTFILPPMILNSASDPKNINLLLGFKSLRILSCIYLSILCLGFPLQAQSKPFFEDQVLKAGAADSKITPPIGSIMGNSYGITVSEGIHDDLYAKTIVFEKDETKAVFIALDLISLPHQVVMRTRELIFQRTGIPRENIIMTATHVHAGPQMNPLFWDAIGGLPKQKSEEYLSRLPEMIFESVGTAIHLLQPVRVSIGKTKQISVNFNRRFLMKDGSFRMNPGRLNPNTIRPAGPVDPDLSIVLFETLDAKPMAILVNFALHVAVVSGDRFSADFPGKISDLLKDVYGEDMVSVFTNGTSGNINHINVNLNSALDGYEEAARIGTILAADVMKTLPTLSQIPIHDLKVRTEPVILPVASASEEELKWAEGIIDLYGSSSPPPFNDVVKAWRILDVASMAERERIPTTTVPLVSDGSALQSEVQVIAFGDELALVGFPGDAFVELGLGIKLNSPFPFTIVNEQSANGTISYVPNSKAFPESGYEVISTRFEQGGGEILVDTTIRILMELYGVK
ncbi:neutral/alkaline non-lysosomal ceramidase N-terminal domain-containing protein [Lunatibacter salilacus]|uniref:neutral/alkaline non-lysosomal ceramidase N-terminal domain-containing protein n=1 Tax=Lunatibacter salilacus TaxID=2483804 RepID=UPI00131C7592|nr:neutral/alkaline non-lysosomal ceramidase N-terminal domain-containing protein [Lunatibacter salilacus]